VWTTLKSYSLYPLQQPFLVLEGRLDSLSAELVATFAAAYLSYRFVERPALRILRPKGKKDSALATPIVCYAEPEANGLRGTAFEAL
jgi:peptidoglycan/LPS O-acetylase OafA/YrhL